MSRYDTPAKRAFEEALRATNAVYLCGGGGKNSYWAIHGQDSGVGYFVECSPRVVRAVKRTRAYGNMQPNNRLPPLDNFTVDSRSYSRANAAQFVAWLEKHREESRAMHYRDMTASVLLRDSALYPLMLEGKHWMHVLSDWGRRLLEQWSTVWQSLHTTPDLALAADMAVGIIAQIELPPRKNEAQVLRMASDILRYATEENSTDLVSIIVR